MIDVRWKLAWTAVVFCGLVIPAQPARSAERTADQILKEIDALKLPALDDTKKNDRVAVRDIEIKRRETAEKRARLIRDLFKVAPDQERIRTLLAERWATLSAHPEKGRYAELVRELETVVSRSDDQKLKIEASFVRAQLKLNPVGSKSTPDPTAALDFLKLAPADPRAAGLLASAVTVTRDATKKAALLERLKADFPDSDLAGMFADHRRSESLGKPFRLEFTDAITGTTVSMKGLKGKVVVIDFWATWCGPCVAEMPNMKALYAKFKDQGVEFIGVSLDQPKDEGGLDKLKQYVKNNGIKWPQYYQGNGWKSEFSKSWEVNGIPCVFVVDAEGKLHSVEARGQLDRMIPELLKKKSIAATTTPAGARS